MQDKIYGQIEKISDKEIKNFTKTAFNNAPVEFWTAPCSRTGTNHPPEDNGENGLVRHTIKCAEISNELARFFNLNDYGRDIVFSATLLHDIKKNGSPWGESTNPQHGLIAYGWLEQFTLEPFAKQEIRNCVRYHMARWTEPEEELVKAKNPTVKQLIVQLSDYIGSRKCASFLPGLNVSEYDIKRYLIK